MKRIIPICLMLAGPAFALSVQRIVYQDVDGTRYVWMPTVDGFTITAEDDADQVFNLKNDCVATHKKLGTGRWGSINGGWLIEFGGEPILEFPGQGAPIVPADCRL